jgi:hypothetical protein
MTEQWRNHYWSILCTKNEVLTHIFIFKENVWQLVATGEELCLYNLYRGKITGCHFAREVKNIHNISTKMLNGRNHLQS